MSQGKRIVDRAPRGRTPAGCPAAGRSGHWATSKARSCVSARRPGRPGRRSRPDTSNGSVNCMHDSLNPLAGLTPLTGMWLNCIFGGVGVGLINMLDLPDRRRLPGRPDGRPHAGVPGQEGRGPRDEAGHAGAADPPADDPGADRAVRRARTGARSLDEQPRRRTGSPRSCTSSRSASANNGSGFEGLGDTYGFNDRQPTRRRRAVRPALGHRLRPGDAVSAASSRSSPRWRSPAAWRRRSRRRSRPARCAPTRSRSASCCWARSCWSVRCCSCRRPCSARWPNTSGRCRSDGKTRVLELQMDVERSRETSSRTHVGPMTHDHQPTERPSPRTTLKHRSRAAQPPQRACSPRTC